MRVTNYVGKLVFEQVSDGIGGESTVSVEPLTRDEALDIAGVVRCKSCRWSKEAPKVEDYHLECFLRPLSMHYTKDDDFCSYGERRYEEGL